MNESGVKTYSAKGLLKFLLFSGLGIFIFFVNVTINDNTTVLLIHAINQLRALIGDPILRVVVMLCCVTVCITCLIAKFSKNPKSIFKTHHKKDTLFSYFCYATSAVFSVMIVFQVGPEFILDSRVGMATIGVAISSFTAIMVASFLVTLLVEFGLLEFLSKFIEPIMRVVFKIPGAAAIDALASFVASPAVGVMITNNFYKKGLYTQREACSITTSFAICSIGAFAFLANIAGAGAYFSQIVLTAFILHFVMAAIMVRLPILRWKKDIYIDGAVQTAEQRKPGRYSASTIPDAIREGAQRAEGTSLTVFGSGVVNGIRFAQKVMAYVVSLSVIFLFLAFYTPIVNIIGLPIAPILTLLGVPYAAEIAPGVLLGVFALSLPATLAGAAGVSAAAAFFVVILSTNQIIFFTESANAMLESEIPLSIPDLVITFLLRTVFMIPFAAIAMHIFF